jgi:nitroreductase
MTMSLEQVNNLKQAPVHGMLPALAQRWSSRAFKETPVSTGDLKIILEAARWSASSSNLQPWRFFVGIKGTETYDQIHATLVPFNQSWAGKANVLILGFAHRKDGKGNINKYAEYDLGQASALLTIQADALGLKTHSMGGFNHDAAKAAFNLGEDYALGSVIAIGHQDEPSALTNEMLLERELAPRERKPLSEIALLSLDQPLKFD